MRGMKKYLTLITVFTFLLLVTIQVEGKERVICEADNLSESSIRLTLKWTTNNSNKIRITGWKLIGENILEVTYVQGQNELDGWDTRTISNPDYKFPMKIILKNQSVKNTMFSDLPDDNNDKFSILNLYDRGIINGYPDGQFKPNNNVTRAEFAAMIIKAGKFKVDTSKNSTFSDVSNKFWGKNYIMTLTSNNILSGRGNNIFDPRGNVTIGEALAIVDRTFMFYNKENNYNYELKSHWSNKNFKSLVSSGIVKSTDKYYRPYSPNKKATRKDCAIILSRVIEQINQIK
jgi:hypothetical protein